MDRWRVSSTWIRAIAVSLGGPGLFVIAFLDSSFLSFPEVIDLLIILLTTQHKERMVVLRAADDARVDCRAASRCTPSRGKGGEAFLRKRFKRPLRRSGDGDASGATACSRSSIPSILPPPMPFKIFVLAAGVAQVRPLDFILAIAIGRGVRYFGEGLLAV